MCRVLGYLGTPLMLSSLLYEPDNSLITQSYQAKKLQMLNLAGFGFSAWDAKSENSEMPFEYKTVEVPYYDVNLRHLCEKVSPDMLLAHVRGVSLSHEAVVNQSCLHPFHYKNTPIAMAHNGDLYHFLDMRNELLKHIKPEISKNIVTNVDSEWIYALFLSQIKDLSVRHDAQAYVDALIKTLSILKGIRKKLGIQISSSINLFVADGASLVALRYCFDFGCYAEKPSPFNLSFLSLWFTLGHDYGFHDEEWKMIGGSENATSIIISSEPLTQDASSWLEVPEHSVLCVEKKQDKLKVGIIAVSDDI